jgi:hypothetical protein
VLVITEIVIRNIKISPLMEEGEGRPRPVFVRDDEPNISVLKLPHSIPAVQKKREKERKR